MDPDINDPCRRHQTGAKTATRRDLTPSLWYSLDQTFVWSGCYWKNVTAAAGMHASGPLHWDRTMGSIHDLKSNVILNTVDALPSSTGVTEMPLGDHCMMGLLTELRFGPPLKSGYKICSAVSPE